MDRFVGIVTGLAAEARIARGLGRAVAGGGTPDGARDAALRLIREGATSLLSFGVAGGLDPRLMPGDLVTPASVFHNGEAFACDPMLCGRLGAGQAGPVAAVSDILRDRNAKQQLRRVSGAVAVDMESGAVARVAAQNRVPFAVLRAVCDPAGRTVPKAATTALDAHGEIDPWRVIVSVALSPGQLPALLTLARDASRARSALVRRVGDISARGGLVA